MIFNAYLEIGEDAKAVADLTESIELDPTYYWSYMQRAKAYRHLNQPHLAEADERRAARIGPPKYAGGRSAFCPTSTT